MPDLGVNLWEACHSGRKTRQFPYRRLGTVGTWRRRSNSTLSLGIRANGALNLGSVTFEWDARKASANFKKHGVTFEEASSVFFDPLATTYPDPDHSLDERREITLGYTMKKDLVFVSHCERGERIRIIGARPATRAERRKHEEGTGS